MKFMHCNSCSCLVQVNPTGVCLGCQRGFINLPQEDSWLQSPEREKLKLELRKKEIEDAIQEQNTKIIPVRKQAGRRKRVSIPHKERKKATNKS